MSGADRNWHSSIELMKNRMWGATYKAFYNKDTEEDEGWFGISEEGLPQQSRLLLSNGGYNQQDRMIFDKRRSLDRALLYSYQGANVERVSSDKKTHHPRRALINPNKLKQDYDDKIISIHKESGYKPGDVFKWLNTNTYWLIYLQDLTELAYFRGEIRKCSYQIDWVDDEGEHTTYAAIRGPVETKIDYIQKHKISVDNPNYSLNLLLPKNEETLKYFKRYSKFYLQNEEIKSSDVCWRVEAIDWVSTPGILEISAVEYYSNPEEDDIQNGVAGALIVKQPEAFDPNNYILGETFIKPKKEYIYEFVGISTSTLNWSVSDKKAPIKLEVNGRKVILKWVSNYSGQFDLICNDQIKTIIVESLF